MATASARYPQIAAFAHNMRRNIIEISHHSGTSTHIGGALSMTEAMAVLYGHVMRYDANNPRWDGRDRFILSKGHGVLGFFPALLEAGFIDDETFQRFQQNGSPLIAHPVMNLDLGIESSNGSLGQGLSMAVGIAKAAQKQRKSFHTYSLIGDGEANEGCIWEAAMLASHWKLNNLTVVVDYNRMQNDGPADMVLEVDNIGERFAAFGWHVIDVDGHDIDALVTAFETPHQPQQPKAVIAHTVKGKGVSFMENDNSWHHNRLTKTNYDLAIAELGDGTNQKEPVHGNQCA